MVTTSFLACTAPRLVAPAMNNRMWEHPIAQEMVSTTDPDAAWAVKSGPATLGYYDNYLIDTTSRVILSVDASPARFRQVNVIQTD